MYTSDLEEHSAKLLLFFNKHLKVLIYDGDCKQDTSARPYGT